MFSFFLAWEKRQWTSREPRAESRVRVFFSWCWAFALFIHCFFRWTIDDDTLSPGWWLIGWHLVKREQSRFVTGMEREAAAEEAAEAAAMGKDIVVVASLQPHCFSCCDVIALLYRVVGEVERPRVVSSHLILKRRRGREREREKKTSHKRS